MTDRILAALAFLVLFGFLAILVWFVPSPDLVIVIAVTLGFGIYDSFLHGKAHNPLRRFLER